MDLLIIAAFIALWLVVGVVVGALYQIVTGEELDGIANCPAFMAVLLWPAVIAYILLCGMLNYWENTVSQWTPFASSINYVQRKIERFVQAFKDQIQED